jgi:hypothetical protein
MGLTSSQPGSSSGFSFHVVFRHPKDPNAKPPPVTKVVLHSPQGTRFDTAGVPRCEASDAELRALGNNGCPQSSRVGAGTLTAMSGFGPPFDPLHGDNTVYNGPGQIIELITVQGTNVTAGFDRLTVDGSTLTGHPPFTPGGPPDGQTAIRSIDFEIPARAGTAGGYITSPTVCPPNGRWTSTGEFGFADGGAETVSSRTPCEPGPR